MPRPADHSPARLVTAAMALLVVFGGLAVPARAQIRVATYNVAQLQGDPDRLADVIESMHGDDVEGYAVPVTVFVFQEVLASQVPTIGGIIGATRPPGTAYQLATYVPLGEDPVGGTQICYYRADVLSEDVAAHRDIATGAGRMTDRWRFTLDGYASPEASFYVYSSHLKAGSTPSDVEDRLEGAETLRADFLSLPAGTHIVSAGDFNFSGSSEGGYVLLRAIAPSPGQLVDPLGGGSWAGSGAAFKHTQSPRASGSGGLIGGGMDDRFDFVFGNTDLDDGDGLSIIGASYRAVGNDGNHYNTSINAGNNFYFPGEVGRSNALADDLFAASDHVPVLCDLQVPAILIGSLPPSVGEVIRGADVQVAASILNFADVVVPEGADLLRCIAVGADALSGSALVEVEALGPPATPSFTLDTSVAGPVSGAVNFSALSEGATVFTPQATTTATVLRPSNPSFDGSSDVDETVVETSFEVDTGPHEIAVAIHGLGWDEGQAALDIDALTGLAPLFSLAGPVPVAISSDAGILSIVVDTDGAEPGTVELDLVVETSDEDLPGETTATLALTLAVTFSGAGDDCPEDRAGADLVVGTEDLLALLAAWGPCDGSGDCPADLDGNGSVDTSDLLALLSAWGPCPVP